MSLWIIFLTLPPFHFALWQKNWPVTLGLHTAALITSVGILSGLIAGGRLEKRVFFNPLIIAATAIPLVSLFLLLFQDLPLLSLLGPPETGEGILWYLDISLLMAGMLVVRRHKTLRKLIIYNAFASAISVSLLTAFTDHSSIWQPYTFYDYLAFHGLFLLPFILWLPGKYLTYILILVSLLMVLFSENRTAVVILPVTILLVLLLRFFIGDKTSLLRKVGIAMVTGMPIFMMLVTFLVGSSYIDSGSDSVQSTLRSRNLMNNVVYTEIRQDPSILITGRGWGRYVDTLIKNVNLDGVDLYSERGDSRHWYAAEFLFFHSHNFLVDALLAGGLGIALLQFLIPVLIVAYASKRYLPFAIVVAVCYIALATTWFQYPGSIPFMAVSFALLVKTTPVRRHSTLLNSTLPLALSSFTTFLLSVSIVFVISSGITVNQLLSSSQVPEIDKSVFTGRYGDYLVPLSSRALNEIKIKNAGRAELDNFKYFFLALEQQVEDGSTIRAEIYALNLRAEIAFDEDYIDKTFRANVLENWKLKLEQFLQRAPERTDMAIPYFLWLISHQKDNDVFELSDSFVTHNQLDAVGLWFSGLVLITRHGYENEGIRRMKLALRQGIESLTPIEAEWKQQLLNY